MLGGAERLGVEEGGRRGLEMREGWFARRTLMDKRCGWGVAMGAKTGCRSCAGVRRRGPGLAGEARGGELDAPSRLLSSSSPSLTAANDDDEL